MAGSDEATELLVLLGRVCAMLAKLGRAYRSRAPRTAIARGDGPDSDSRE